MPLVDDDRWTGPPNRPVEPRRRNGLIQRHLWPPSVPGFFVIAVVASIGLGLIGGYCYTQSGNAEVTLQDPAGPEPVAEWTIPTSVPSERPTTTKPQTLSVEALSARVAPSVWRVNTLDEAGRPVEASALVAGSFGGQSFLLTSFAAVRASTLVPGPPIVARNGGSEAQATLWTWQEDDDIALLVIPRAAPPLLWASDDPEGRVDQRVFVASEGTGLAPGKILATSATAIQHNISVDDRRRGGALVNERGEVLAMVSAEYNPGGVGTDRIFVAVPVRSTCGAVLQCGGGNASPAAPTTTVAR